MSGVYRAVYLYSGVGFAYIVTTGALCAVMGPYYPCAGICIASTAKVARRALHGLYSGVGLLHIHPIGWGNKKINIIYIQIKISMLPSPNRQPGLISLYIYYYSFILIGFLYLSLPLNLILISQYCFSIKPSAGEPYGLSLQRINQNKHYGLS